MEYQVFRDPDLYKPPLQRAAYSDRMALMMAELSALAYIPFENPTEVEIADEVVQKLRAAKDSNEMKRELESFWQAYQKKFQQEIKPQAQKDLISHLSKAEFDLVNTYSVLETQAFLAKRDYKIDGKKTPGIVVLSFRGTEKKIADWRTDLDAAMTVVDGIAVHQGFWNAFQIVKKRIQSDLEPLLAQGYSLYVTGHSLGGALALFATYSLGEDSTGACYTFGSPRVAGHGFDQSIKTPIYRIVNAHDVVPRTPPATVPYCLKFLVSLIKFPGRNALMRILDNYIGYVHHGDMRYLRRCKEEAAGKFDDIELLANPSVFDRARWFLAEGVTDLKGSIKDHSIQLYCDKLRAYAKKRN